MPFVCILGTNLPSRGRLAVPQADANNPRAMNADPMLHNVLKVAYAATIRPAGEHSSPEWKIGQTMWGRSLTRDLRAGSPSTVGPVEDKKILLELVVTTIRLLIVSLEQPHPLGIYHWLLQLTDQVSFVHLH